MAKKLVFSFYLSEKTYTQYTNELHFKSLSEFCNIFDEATITILKDDDVSDELLLECKNRFVSIFLNCKKISINILPNSNFREAIVFYNEIVLKLGADDLVFFGHNKGTTNINHSKEQISTWILGMHFFNLFYINEVEKCLHADKFASYGAYQTLNSTINNKYKWSYMGTFFWINSKRLYNYLKCENMFIPELDGRFYAEDFLGNILPAWPCQNAGSHDVSYIRNAEDYYRKAKHYTNVCYGNVPEFEEFYKKITNENY